MKLSETSYQWSIKHLFKESDTDLFPRPFELNVLHEMQSELIGLCKDIDIGSYKWHASRRFIVPKNDVSYRVGTQLDLIDSIILGAIIYEYGKEIENKRVPESQKVVFSYRFKPLSDGTLYGNKNAWNNF